MVLPRASLSKIGILSTIGTISAVYILTTAVMGPVPPLIDHISGSFIVVSID